MVQACVRRWLARVRYQRAQWQLASSVVTLQRYVRGWLTRRRVAKLEHQQREMQIKKKQEKMRKLKKEKEAKSKDEGNKKEKKNWFKAKLVKRLSSQVRY